MEAKLLRFKITTQAKTLTSILFIISFTISKATSALVFNSNVFIAEFLSMNDILLVFFPKPAPESFKEFKTIAKRPHYSLLNKSKIKKITFIGDNVPSEKFKLLKEAILKTIQEIEEKLAKGIATVTDSVYMNLLKELNTCKQGMDRQTAPFQEAREFEISEFNLWQVNNVPVEGHLGDLVMAVEECRGQQKLLKVVGQGYAGMPTGEDDKQFSLLEHFEGVQALNFDDHTATHRNIDKSLICGNNQYPLTHQAQFGCEVLYDGKTLEQIKAENELRFGTDGKIGYQSESLDRYHAFMEQYGNKVATVEDKANAEKLAEPIAKEMIENNNFVQNKLRNE